MSLRRRFREKSPFEQRVALEFAVLLFATRIGLRLCGFRRWHRFVASRAAQSPSAPDTNGIQMIASMARTVVRHLPFHFNCLDQSLALLWLLRRHALPGELRVGVRKESGSFEAHAWVEINGCVLNEPDREHRHFVPFEQPIYPAEPRLP